MTETMCQFSALQAPSHVELPLHFDTAARSTHRLVSPQLLLWGGVKPGSVQGLGSIDCRKSSALVTSVELRIQYLKL